MRWTVALFALGFIAGLGCALLEPYPGGEDPAAVLAGVRLPDGSSPLVGTGPGGSGATPQDPLINPAVDPTISAVSNNEFIIAYPGESFIIDLVFTAQNGNVVGGGIQFPGSDLVQWTLIDALEGQVGGQLRFAYVVPEDVCNDVPPLCHEILTRQFAVGSNATGADVDGDGQPDGDFVVSPAAEVAVILKCASCESTSCQELLPGPNDESARQWSCSSCQQPYACGEAGRLCFDYGKPKYGTEEATQFDLFFGLDGLSWKSREGCAAGLNACDNILANAQLECVTEEE